MDAIPSPADPGEADLNVIGHNGAKVQLWACNAQPQQDWRTR